MTGALSPQRWANDLTHVLNSALGHNRFPVDVRELALQYSAQRYPDDPVALVRGELLPGFDGALIRAPAGKKGWGIFVNTGISSKGRINFTLGHEFGHYLMHRLAYPNGIRCRDQDVVRWDSEYGQIEHQANLFAAWLLMPLDDYRRQIDPRCKVDLDMISGCADRYRVSLIAALLRWLEYTECRAVLVVSRDRLHSCGHVPASGPSRPVRFSAPPAHQSPFRPPRLRGGRTGLSDGRAGLETCPRASGSTRSSGK